MFSSDYFTTSAKTNKMDWFIKEHTKGTLSHLITDSNKAMGTVVMPTGYGKSAQMFADAIYHIEHCNGKIAIIFAGPILRLVAQTVNDKTFIMGNIFSNLRDNHNIRFFINSSASGEDYDYRSINANPYNFDKDFTRHFINDDNAKVALIASCYDSLYKVANKIEKIKESAVVCAYLDEAHLIITNGRDSIDEYDADNKDGKKQKEAKETYDNIHRLCKCDYLYAVTATPDDNITKAINKEAYEKYGDEDYCKNDYNYRIVDIPAKEAIRDNIILPFNMDLKAVPEDMEYHITPQMCIEYMKKVHINDTNKVPHKILVNCANSRHLIYLRDALITSGYKVYSTSSRDGAMASDKDEMRGVDAMEFIKMVDDEENDCFVLHIKQLTQGIDIKTLTDTIMYLGSVINAGDQRRIIQRIGRTLRTASGERNHSMDERTKKFGNVLFVIPNGDTCAHIGGQIEKLLFKYYGFDGVLNISRGIDGNGSEKGGHKTINTDDNDNINPQDIIDNFIADWTISMEDYVRDNVSKKNAFLIAHNGKGTYEIAVKEIKEYSNKFAMECELSELITDTMLMDMTYKLVMDYEIA